MSNDDLITNVERIEERTSGKATASLVLGVLSFCLWILAGIPAIVLGILGLRDIERSRGALKGRGIATAGIVMGGVSSMLIVPGIMLAMLLPAVNAARENGRRMTCANNLKQIGIALMNYHDQYGIFPPAVTRDADGKAMHSWRVLILPFLDRADLYQRYNFDQPWDSPENMLVQMEMPPVYRCPSQPLDGDDTQTAYVAVVGPNTAWPPDRALRQRDFVDGLSNTILLVEVGESGFGWTEPRDADASIFPGPAGMRDLAPSSFHPGGSNVLLADSSVQFMTDDTDLAVWQELLSPGGAMPQAESGEIEVESSEIEVE
jgi:prepilin-type processing-associated H-X9-DG protein